MEGGKDAKDVGNVEEVLRRIDGSEPVRSGRVQLGLNPGVSSRGHSEVTMDNRRIIGEASNASILGRGIRCLIQVHEDGIRKKQRNRAIEGSRMSMLYPPRFSIEQNFALPLFAFAVIAHDISPLPIF